MNPRPSCEELQKEITALQEKLKIRQEALKHLASGKSSQEEKSLPPPSYGDISDFNTCRQILHAVGKDTLRRIAEDAIDLVESSVVIYEETGDYAFGLLVSDWCRILSDASRRLCNTADHAEALRCGRWVCHENCWENAAKKSIASGKGVDSECPGGIRVYSEPIYSSKRPIGAIVIGYGNPPYEPEKLRSISELYKIECNDLKKAAMEYPVRPPLIFELAKKRLSVSAQLIGEMVYRARSEQALRESEEKYRLIFENSPLGVLHFDEKGVITACNNLFVNALNTTRERLIGLKMLDLPDEKIVAAVRDSLEGRNGYFEGEYHSVTGGGIVSARGLFAPCTNSDGRVTGGVGILENITERKKAENALRQSEERYRFLVEESNDIIWIFDLFSMEFTYCSHSTQRILGYSINEVMGWNLDKIFTSETRKALRTAFGEMVCGKNSSNRIIMEAPHIHSNGDLVWMEIDAVLHRDDSGEPVSFTGVSRNISDRKRSEEERELLHAQLRHAQKMEAVGTLTGGIAHDFNNLLSIILGYTELIQTVDQKDEQTRKWSDQIMEAGLRARDVVRHLLTFSRKKEEAQVPMQVDLVVEEALKMMRSVLPSSIEFRKRIDAGLPRIEADPTQIHQVIINLCKNAADAMEDNGGTLAVRLEKTLLDTWDAASSPELAPGEYVRLTVADTGQGIHRKDLDRIFDPYFTTKPTGKGTGLGLAVVHGIMRAHGGGIRVHSDIGRNTIFQLFFPVAGKKSREDETESGHELPPGSEAILLVDDEPSMADLNRLRLQKLGYKVVSGTDPAEALETFRIQPHRFDLVITDMTMPGMTGDKLAEHILKIRTDMKIILCTGFNEKINSDSAREIGVAGYLEKPFGMYELAVSVREIIDGQKADEKRS